MGRVCYQRGYPVYSLLGPFYFVLKSCELFATFQFGYISCLAFIKKKCVRYTSDFYTLLMVGLGLYVPLISERDSSAIEQV